VNTGDHGGYDKAIAHFTEAIRLDPKSADAYINRGSAYGKKGESDKAIADFTEAIRLAPRFFQAYCGRAIACGKRDNLDKAIAECTEAIRLNAKYATAYCRFRGAGQEQWLALVGTDRSWVRASAWRRGVAGGDGEGV